MTTATALPPYDISPATAADMPFIRDTVARLRLCCERLGFLRTEILAPELEAKIARVEGVVRSGVVGMVYDRRIEQRPTLADVYRAQHAIQPYLQRTPPGHHPAL